MGLACLIAPVGLKADDYVSILDAMLEGFQIVDPELRYIHLNETAAQHGRSTKEALLGRTMMECYPGIEHTEVFALIRSCVEERTSHLLENDFTYPDGSVGHFELRIQPVPQGASILSIDVTERKLAQSALAKAEERLHHAQRMEAVGSLAAGLAHDFNNLLTVILAEGERALSRTDGATGSHIEAMVAAARASADLTRQLLAYGRRTLLDRRAIDLSDVVRGLDPLLRPSLEPRIGLHLDAPRELACVEADRSQVEQIIMNLVLNARDACDGPGRVTVALSRTVLDAEHARVHPGATPGPHAVLTVADTGKGMDEETVARVFEPFFTTKERGRGTGLGLATVYGIVKQHGGNIWVYSELGVGTTFKIYLPATDCAHVEQPRSDPPPEAVASGRPATGRPTVLVADDAEIMRKLIEVILSGAGYRVLVAASGGEALEIWDREGDSVALLLTDATMPGMSGAELIARLRERRADLPIVCTSGYRGRDLAERGALPAGVAFVEKPFSPRVLLECIAASLERS
jgi:PAS domain S-box-containing protein